MDSKKPVRKGRPPKAANKPTVESVDTQPVARTKKIKREIQKQDSLPSSYVVVNKGGGIVLKLKGASIQVYDEEKGYPRQIRYCPMERSIFVDEQSDNATVEQVFFYEKSLLVPPSKPNLIAFLDAHPQNQANGGTVFRKENAKKDFESEVVSEFLIHDAISIIKSSSIDDLAPVAMALHVDIDKPNIEVKRNLVRLARSTPQKFLDMVSNPLVNVRGQVKQAFDFDIVRENGGAVVWYDTNKLIVTIPAGQSGVEVLARFCMTDNGNSVLTDIERQLAEIA